MVVVLLVVVVVVVVAVVAVVGGRLRPERRELARPRSLGRPLPRPRVEGERPELGDGAIAGEEEGEERVAARLYHGKRVQLRDGSVLWELWWEEEGKRGVEGEREGEGEGRGGEVVWVGC